MMVYSVAAIEYSQECTNHDEHDKHGSGEPVNKALWHYTTSYIQCLWCDITGPRNIHNLLFFSLLQFHPKTHWISAEFTCHKTPPNWCAGKAWSNNSPKLLAEPKCDSNPRFLLARNKCDSSSRYWLAREPPFPAQNPQERPGPPSPPLPPAAPRNGGGGGGGRLTRLAFASWTGTFPFIPLTWTIYMSQMIQHLLILYRADQWIKV